MKIERLKKEQINMAVQLARDVFATCVAPDYSQEGAAVYLSGLDSQAIQEQWAAGKLHIWGAVEENYLVAMCVLKDNGNITMLYVLPQYQRRGIGRSLIEVMRSFCMQNKSMTRMTARVVPGAVQAYMHCGFRIVSGEHVESGMRVVPMEMLMMPGDIRPAARGKNDTALIVGVVIAVAVILIGLMAILGMFFVHTARTMRYAREYDNGLYEEYEYEDEFDFFQEEPDFGTENPNDGGIDASTESLDSYTYYTAENLTYTVTEENYTNMESGSYLSVREFDVDYPKINGLHRDVEAKINQVLKDCAMSTTDLYFLNPTQDIKEYLVETGDTCVASEVNYRITYMDENIISVIFEDHYFLGNIYLEFLDLRTRVINLKDGTVYDLGDVVDTNSMFAADYHRRLEEKYKDEEVIKGLTDETFQRTLSGEIVDNRYYSNFFLTTEGLEVGLTYHYQSEDGNVITRGWITAPYTRAEFAESKIDSSFWDVVKSNN